MIFIFYTPERSLCWTL